MKDERPFARPESHEVLAYAKEMLELFATVAGRPLTQEDMDRATRAAGLPYRINVDDIRRMGMA